MSEPTFTRRVFGLVEASACAAFEETLISVLGPGYRGTFHGTSKTHEEFSTQVTEAEFAKLIALADDARGVHLYREPAIGVDNPDADDVVKDPDALPQKPAEELKWTKEAIREKHSVNLDQAIPSIVREVKR